MTFSLLILLLLIVYSLVVAFKPSSLSLKHKYHDNIIMKIDYRNLKINDIDSCGVLCAEVFEGPFEGSSWFNPSPGMKRTKAINGHRMQLKERYEEKLKKGLNHAMVIVNDDDKTIDNYSDINDGIVAFMEVGMLPSPIPIIKEWQGNSVETFEDVPYIGNLIVSPGCRRRGIANKLIRIALKVTEKWNFEYLYLAVDIDNIEALNLYAKVGFEVILDERDLISRSITRTARLYMRKAASISPSLSPE